MRQGVRPKQNARAWISASFTIGLRFAKGHSLFNSAMGLA
jgi:hypothetical protein